MPDATSATPTIVRPMEEADASAIHDIHTACLLQTLSSHYSPEQLAAWLAGRTPQGYLRGAANGEVYLVAELDGAIVGYANWQEGEQELLSLFVRPGLQKQGIGSLLFSACDAQAHIQWVKATLPAVDFYEHFGFSVVRQDAMEKRGVLIPHIVMER